MKAEISRRSLMKTSALGSLALASSAFTLPFSQMVRAAEAPVEEKAVWSSCTVNCGSRCLLRLHVKDDTVYWVESDTTGDDVYGNHQVRACLRGRSIRRRMNHPDRLKYPMKRVGKRGEGKFERISWDEALDTISDNLRRILKDYGNEAVHVLYGTGVDGGNITNSNVPYRLMNSCGGFLSRYGSYSTAQISAAMSYMFGANDGNSPDDIANTKLVVMFGNNPAETRMSGGGVTYYVEQARERSNARRSESGEGVQHLIMRQTRYAVRGIVFMRSDFNAINGDVNGGNHTTHMVDVAFKGGGVFLAPTDGHATVAGDFTFHRQLIAGRQ